MFGRNIYIYVCEYRGSMCMWLVVCVCVVRYMRDILQCNITNVCFKFKEFLYLITGNYNEFLLLVYYCLFYFIAILNLSNHIITFIIYTEIWIHGYHTVLYITQHNVMLMRYKYEIYYNMLLVYHIIYNIIMLHLKYIIYI